MKYRVTRTWIYRRTGNAYYPKVYEENQLPQELKDNKLYCVPLDNTKYETVTIPVVNNDNNLKVVDKDNTIINPEQTIVVEKKTDGKKINLNTANIEELVSVTGIGQSSAEKIIKNRPIQKLDDLENFLKNTKQINFDLLEI